MYYTKTGNDNNEAGKFSHSLEGRKFRQTVIEFFMKQAVVKNEALVASHPSTVQQN